eukprot:scaffold2846_cov231-Alexandrium_tamarense.AAC.11
MNDENRNELRRTNFGAKNTCQRESSEAKCAVVDVKDINLFHDPVMSSLFPAISGRLALGGDLTQAKKERKRANDTVVCFNGGVSSEVCLVEGGCVLTAVARLRCDGMNVALELTTP